MYDELVWLYKNAYAFIYPSLFEGFGLPILEAMHTGNAVY
ncbi:MAG: glycosyltransferase family 4 protein [Lachnospiraceae bacterium]|nr:glycosyltransferase family 4 protein [Lachnospiraceae bacterium]